MNIKQPHQKDIPSNTHITAELLRFKIKTEDDLKQSNPPHGIYMTNILTNKEPEIPP